MAGRGPGRSGACPGACRGAGRVGRGSCPSRRGSGRQRGVGGREQRPGAAGSAGCAAVDDIRGGDFRWVLRALPLLCRPAALLGYD